MAKRKKTREQKIVADSRHQTYSLSNFSPTFSVKNIAPVVTPGTQTTTISYLKHDILKTSTLTAAILLFQILLLVLLKNHVIRIPVISY